MASGEIEHKELPDELLHEPKGAQTATAGTLYVADGQGAGEFKKVPVSSLDITVPSVADLSVEEVPNLVKIYGDGLSQVADGRLTDILAIEGVPQEVTNKINENAVEFYALYLDLVLVNTAIKKELGKLADKVDDIVAALKSMGLLND